MSALSILSGAAGGLSSTASARAAANTSSSTGNFEVVGSGSRDTTSLVVVAGIAILAVVLIARG